MIYKDYFRQKLLEQSFPQLSPNLVPNSRSNIDALAKASGSSVRPNVQGAIDRLRGEINNRRMEAAASQIHDEWMRRNPKQDWNAAQHVPYGQLPESEKEKDREHVRMVQSILQDPSHAQDEQYHPIIANQIGSILHERWREGHESRGGGPRMKSVSTGGQVDINVPWEQLHPEWKKENYEAGLAAVRAVRDHFLPGM